MASMKDFYIGLFLAISSSIFIGSSFILKKKALLRYANRSNHRASSGGFGYLKDWLWWSGTLLMGAGEGLNFAAYIFAPATLVTPLGALSVLVTTVLSSRLLKEKLNFLGKIGCCVCLLGSTMIVIHSPKEENLDSMEQLATYMKTVAFGLWVFFVFISAGVLIFFCAPRYGNSNILVYILVCSVIGSLSVLGVKGLGLAITQTLRGEQQYGNWLTWFWLISVIFCVSVQLIYLNKALDVFNTAFVTPIYYIFFTTFVMIASGILFQEWTRLITEDIMGIIVGFLTTVIGIFQMQIFKDINVTLKQLTPLLKGGGASSTNLAGGEGGLPPATDALGLPISRASSTPHFSSSGSNLNGGVVDGGNKRGVDGITNNAYVYYDNPPESMDPPPQHFRSTGVPAGQTQRSLSQIPIGTAPAGPGRFYDSFPPTAAGDPYLGPKRGPGAASNFEGNQSEYLKNSYDENGSTHDGDVQRYDHDRPHSLDQRSLSYDRSTRYNSDSRSSAPLSVKRSQAPGSVPPDVVGTPPRGGWRIGPGRADPQIGARPNADGVGNAMNSQNGRNKKLGTNLAVAF